MPDFESPWQGLQQGLQGGIGLGLQIQNTRANIKKQQDEHNMNIMSQGIQLAKVKGILPEQQIAFINGTVGPAYKELTGRPFPVATVENLDTLSPLIDSLHAVGASMSKGDVSPEAGWGIGNDLVSHYHAKLAKDADVSEREKAAIEAAMAPIKSGQETAAKLKEKLSGGESDSPSKIKAAIQRKFLSSGLDSLTPQEHALIADDLQDPSFRMAATLYSQNLANMGNLTSEKQLAAFDGLRTVIKGEMDRQARGVASPPGAAPGPASGAGHSKVNVYKTDADANAAAARGEIKPGDILEINGQQVVAQ